MRLSIKIALLGIFSVLVTAMVLVLLAVGKSGEYNTLAQKEVDQLIDMDLDHITQGMYILLKMEDESVQEQVDQHIGFAWQVLKNAGEIKLSDKSQEWIAVNSITGEKQKILLPLLTAGEKPLADSERENWVTEEITSLVGETAIIFQRMNPRGDMLNISLSGPLPEGVGGVGSFIPAVNADGSPNPLISAVLHGKTYKEKSPLYRGMYFTSAYDPIKDKEGNVVGMLCVNIRDKVLEARLRRVETRFRRKILQTQVGRSGYVYVIGTKGEEKGQYIFSFKGERDGENIWNIQDDRGNYPIREIVEKALALKPGERATHRYLWQNPGHDPVPQWKIAHISYYEPWGWVIGTSVYEEDLHHYRTILSLGQTNMTNFMVLAGLLITLLMGFLGVMVAESIASPLKRMTSALETVIEGKLNYVEGINSKDEMGVLAKTFNLMTDRLKESLENLTQSEMKYRNIIDNALEGIFQSTLEGRIITANQAMAKILGFDSPQQVMEELTDMGNQIYANPSERQAIISELLEKGMIMGWEVNLILRDKQNIWVSMNARLVRDESDNPLFIEGFINDITARKQAEENLRKSNQTLSAVINASPVAIFTLNREGIVTMWSPSAEKIFGWSREEVIGKFNPIVPKEKIQEFLSDFSIVIGGRGYSREVRRQRKDGILIYISLSTAPLHDAEGKITGSVGIMEDITNRKRAEEELYRNQQELKRLNEELEMRVARRTEELKKINDTLVKTLDELQQTQTQLVESEKMSALGRLVAGVAHEINTPLGIGFTAASYLSEKSRIHEELYKYNKLKKSNLNEFFGIVGESSCLILSNLDRAAKLIQNFKQISVDQSSGERRKFNLKEYISDILASLRHRLKKENHKIIIDSPEDVVLDSYPGAFYQILTNLIINSLVHGFEEEKEGIIKIEVIREKDRLFILYSDDGRGISAEDLKHIFEPFYTTRRDTGGTGLGLHIVYNLVTQTLAGKIQCRSTPGKETIFTIDFPYAQERKEEHKDEL